MTNQVDKKLYFQGENLLLKHLHRAPQGTNPKSTAQNPILETLTFFRIGLTSPSQSLDYDPSWKASYRYVEQFFLRVQSQENNPVPLLEVEHISPEGFLQGDTQSAYNILVADWEEELQEEGISPSKTLLSLPESVLIFIVGEYSDGHKIKLGEMTQGKIDSQIYRRLQREMVEMLLNPDWEEVLWIF
jgi:hypothetical protein|nr:MAG TPA: hypothetical protein [Caudoviricetes sp.]